MALAKKLKIQSAALTKELNLYIEQSKLINPNEPTTYQLSGIKMRRSLVTPLLDQFKSIALERQIVCGSDDETEISRIDIEVVDFIEKYGSLMALLNEILEETENSKIKIKESNNQCCGGHSDSEHLRKIEIKVFSGNITEWSQFKTMFISLVHSKDKYDLSTKFYHLCNLITGDALDVITSVEVTPENYNSAWQLLLDRYDNKRLIIAHHLQSFIDTPSTSIESSASLRSITTHVRKHIVALQNVIPREYCWDAIITHITLKKLDKDTQEKWYSSPESRVPNPTFESLLRMLSERAEILETRDNSKPNSRSNLRKSLVSTKMPTCYFCNDKHLTYKCPSISNLTIDDRYIEIGKKNLCYNCLKPGHLAESCPSVFNCHVCHRRHNTILHKAIPSVEPNNDVGNNFTLTGQVAECNNVLLSTALVNIPDAKGKLITARALLDSGSQTSFITKEFANLLNLPSEPASIAVLGLGRSRTQINSKINITLTSMHNTFSKPLSCFVINKITDNVPTCDIKSSYIKFPKYIKLADPLFFKSKGIDLLLGADVFWHLLNIGKLSLGKDGVSVQKTELGWIITGMGNKTKSVNCYMSHNMEIQAQLQQFWEIESVENANPHTNEEIACETHYQKTMLRNEDGRFVVTIPFKESPKLLGESKSIATKRFLSLEKN